MKRSMGGQQSVGWWEWLWSTMEPRLRWAAQILINELVIRFGGCTPIIVITLWEGWKGLCWVCCSCYCYVILCMLCLLKFEHRRRASKSGGETRWERRRWNWGCPGPFPKVRALPSLLTSSCKCWTQRVASYGWNQNWTPMPHNHVICWLKNVTQQPVYSYW